jgi:YfiH family protein
VAGIGWIEAEWRAPAGVRAGCTTRAGGVSGGPFAGFNLGTHVGDDEAAVAWNRAALRTALALPDEPLWLRQVHGRDVVRHDGRAREPTADAAVAFEPGRVLAVLTADCLPVVFAARDASRVGIAHAGWRGLAAGVLEATVAALGGPAGLLAWLGPGIGTADFEVGGEVRSAFVDADPGAAAAFAPNARGRWQADLGALAGRRLAALGVELAASSGASTFADAARYYSYRREPRTGRMATLVWLMPPPGAHGSPRSG